MHENLIDCIEAARKGGPRSSSIACHNTKDQLFKQCSLLRDAERLGRDISVRSQLEPNVGIGGCASGI
jgi:hypothetical protein